MVIKEIKSDNYDLIDTFLIDKNNAYVFQIKEYLETLKLLKYKFKFFGNFKDGKLISLIPVMYKKILFQKKFLYVIPNGIIGSTDAEFFDYVLNELKKDALVIKYSSNLKKEKFDNNQLFDKTIEINLEQSLEEIFNDFNSSTRNTTRKGIKENVQVSISKDFKYVTMFIDSYNDMVKRKGIKSIDKEFMKNVISKLLKNDKGFFAIASYNGKIYNYAFISTVGKRGRYLYGSSISTNEKIPPIGQILHYKVMEYLKENNFYIYDLGGIPSHDPSKNDDIYGVYKFKKGFGGSEVITCYNYKWYKYKILKKLIG